MNTDKRPNEIHTDEDLNRALERIVGAANRNGVDVRGGWVVQDGTRRFDVQITELAAESGGGE